MGDVTMYACEYPDLSLTGRTWRVFESKAGTAMTEFSHPPAAKRTRGLWIWVDGLVFIRPGGDVEAKLLEDPHSPHKYSGYERHVRKQPAITTFASHDHTIIPDLDVETPSDQTVLYSELIWTRRAGNSAGLHAFLASNDLHVRGPHHETVVYAFVGILRVMLESLDRQLVRRERDAYALEEYSLQNKHEDAIDRGENRNGGSVQDEEHPLAQYSALSAPRILAKLRIGVAWLQKQYRAFKRLVNGLWSPAHGASRHGTALIAEGSPSFHDLSDHIKRASTKVEHLRDTHSTLDQLLNAQRAEKTNTTLLRLTWLSIIFLSVGVIVDIFGMNISVILSGHTFEIDSTIALLTVRVALLAATLFYRWENRRDHAHR